MKSRIILFFLALLVANIHAATSDCTPSQIHLSLGDSYYSASGPINPELNPSQVNNNQAYLVWQTPTTSCQYVVIVNDVQTQQEVFNTTTVSPQSISLTLMAEDGTTPTTSLASYTVLLTNLSYGTNYSYSILDQNNASLAGPFQFNLASPNLTSSSNKIIIVGDLDLLQNDSMTLEAVNELLEGDEAYAGMIQIGQVPYYLQNGTDVQNEFNSTLANFTATLPLIMAPGRGETSSNSSFLNFRIRNPLFDATKNQYFSFNLQGIHFVSINLDYYNLTTTNQSQVESWLENDLKSANSTASRETWPFIVVVTSYPLYCTSSENAPETADCATFFAQNEKLDDLFTNSNVDLVISGGMNAYQQLLPTDDSTTQASQDSTLTNSNSTVYVIEGVGSSSQSGVHPGFGVVYAQSNSTGSTLFYEHYDSDTGDKVNSLTLVKTAQGSTPTPTPNDNGQNSGDNTPTPTPTPSDNTPNTGDNTNTNTNTPDNTPTPGDNTNTNTNTTDNTPTPGDNTNTNTNTTDNNQNPNNGTVTPTDDGELEGPTENPNASDPEGSESIVPRLIIPFVIIIAIVLVAIYWKRRRTDPEMESLTTKEYKSNKIYNKRSTDASISMVDLVL